MKEEGWKRTAGGYEHAGMNAVVSKIAAGRWSWYVEGVGGNKHGHGLSEAKEAAQVAWEGRGG